MYKKIGDVIIVINLFIASNSEIKDKIIQVNVNFKLYKNENSRAQLKKTGHFFYYCRSVNELHYAQIKYIKNIEFVTGNSENIHDTELIVKFKNGYFLIKFNNILHKMPLNILKDIYAKNNRKMIGDRRYSIYHTIQVSGFSYSLPEIDSTMFMVTNEFREILLYDNYIIPKDLEKRKTFAKIVNEDNEFSLTLTNEKMIEVDYQYLLGEQHKELYRPYFYEFSLSQSSQEKLKKELDLQNYNEEVLYVIKIISERDIKNPNEEGVLEGDLLFSASPVKRIPAYIKILHTNKDESIESQWNNMNKILRSKISTVKDRKKVELTFMKKVPLSNSPDINYKVKIFNVGQGNWIHILVYDGLQLITKVIFDIGIGKNHSDNSLRALITEEAAKRIEKNDLFVLSHWDSDHIQGVTELKRNQFYTTWIVPDLPKNPSNGARRLAAFLRIDSNIDSTFIDHTLNGSTIFENDYFRLGKGRGKNTSYTVENNSGLILVIKTAVKKMLLPGDCAYSEFPISFNENYEASVISHHGAKIKQAQLKNIKCHTINFAAVCVGEDKKYPDSCHISSVLAQGCQLHETKKIKKKHKPLQYKLT